MEGALFLMPSYRTLRALEVPLIGRGGGRSSPQLVDPGSVLALSGRRLETMLDSSGQIGGGPRGWQHAETNQPQSSDSSGAGSASTFDLRSPRSKWFLFFLKKKDHFYLSLPHLLIYKDHHHYR